MFIQFCTSKNCTYEHLWTSLYRICNSLNNAFSRWIFRSIAHSLLSNNVVGFRLPVVLLTINSSKVGVILLNSCIIFVDSDFFWLKKYVHCQSVAWIFYENSSPNLSIQPSSCAWVNSTQCQCLWELIWETIFSKKILPNFGSTWKYSKIVCQGRRRTRRSGKTDYRSITKRLPITLKRPLMAFK